MFCILSKGTLKVLIEASITIRVLCEQLNGVVSVPFVGLFQSYYNNLVFKPDNVLIKGTHRQ